MSIYKAVIIFHLLADCYDILHSLRLLPLTGATTNLTSLPVQRPQLKQLTHTHTYMNTQQMCRNIPEPFVRAVTVSESRLSPSLLKAWMLNLYWVPHIKLLAMNVRFWGPRLKDFQPLCSFL